MIKTLLVEPQALMRSALAEFLTRSAGVQVVVEADTAEGALEAVRTQPLDLAVMEWVLPGLGGLEAIERMKRWRPTLGIVVVTASVDAPFPRRLLKCGVEALVSKHASARELLRGVKAAREGGRYVSDDVAQRLAFADDSAGSRSPFDGLSARELQVMMMFMEGMRVQDISTKLCLSPKTVSTYRYRMFEKLGVRGEAELARLAMRFGLLDRPVMAAAETAAPLATAHH